jgi:hypothetical protein
MFLKHFLNHYLNFFIHFLLSKLFLMATSLWKVSVECREIYCRELHLLFSVIVHCREFLQSPQDTSGHPSCIICCQILELTKGSGLNLSAISVVEDATAKSHQSKGTNPSSNVVPSCPTPNARAVGLAYASCLPLMWVVVHVVILGWSGWVNGLRL